MKKLSATICFLFLLLAAKAQYRLEALKVTKYFALPVYTDTAAANTAGARTAASFFQTTGGAFFYRNGANTAWVQIANINPAQSGSFTNVYTNTSNAFYGNGFSDQYSTASNSDQVLYGIRRGNSSLNGMRVYNYAGSVLSYPVSNIGFYFDKIGSYGSTELFTMTNSGKLGIKNTAPVYELDVNGAARVAGFVNSGITVYDITTEPGTPPAGQVYEWWDGTTRKAKFDNGQKITLYTKPTL